MAKGPEKVQMLNRFDPVLKDWLEAERHRTGMSMNHLVEKAVTMWAVNLEKRRDASRVAAGLEPLKTLSSLSGFRRLTELDERFRERADG